jgi:hypothetical protein
VREMGDTEQSTVESGDSGDISPATDDQAADGEHSGGSERTDEAPSAEPGESGPAEPSASASAEQGGQRAETSGESGLTTSGTAAEPGESGPAEPGTDTVDEPRGEATAGPSAEADPSAPDAADTADTGSGPEGADDSALAEPGENGPAGEGEPAVAPEPGPAADERGEPGESAEPGDLAEPGEPGESAEPGDLAEPGEPGESAESGERGEPGEPDEPEERRAEEPAQETVDESREQAADEPAAGEPEAAGGPEPADEAAPDDREQPEVDPAREDEPGSERTDGGRDEAPAGDARAPGYGDHDADSGPKTFASNSEAAEYGRAMWGDAAGNLNAQEREALREYSGEKSPGEVGPPDYKEINGFLRGKSAGSPEVANSVQQIDHALQSGAAQENVMVLRETGLGAFDRPVGELRGSIQRDPAYLSTALGSDPAFNPEAPAVLHLEVPAGTPAMYMEGLSQFPAERELLLGRGLQYQVDGVQRTGGRWHIYGKILAP